ncbi:MAG: hypothetical protein WBM50_24375 [Acidimicrobiales bacterium]
MNGVGDDRIRQLRSSYDERLATQDLTHPGYRAAFEEFAKLLLLTTACDLERFSRSQVPLQRLLRR